MPPKTSPATGSTALSPKASISEITQHIWQRYIAQTSQRTFLLDAFMAYLVLVGGIQFVYCVIAGNYVGILSEFKKERGELTWSVCV